MERRRRVTGWLAAAALTVGLVGSSGAAPRDPKRWIPPNAPGQAGQNDLKLTLDPPALKGPGVDLVVKNDVMSGTLQGHAISVTVSANHAEGTGPAGPITLDWTSDKNGSLLLKGSWSGHKVDLAFAPRGITGRLMQSVTPTGRAMKSCRLDVNQLAKGSNLSGLSECLGYDSEPVRYQISPVAEAELNSVPVALLLTAFFETPTSFPVR
jgi:hypothetical protein